MADFIFVAKCFVFTLIIAFCLQFKIGGVTLESRADHFVRYSSVSNYLRQTATGGAMLLKDGYYSAKNFVLDSTKSIRYESKASY